MLWFYSKILPKFGTLFKQSATIIDKFPFQKGGSRSKLGAILHKTLEKFGDPVTQADFKVKLSDIDQGIDIGHSYSKNLEPHEVFFQLFTDINKLENVLHLIDELKTAENQDKKELLKRSIERDEWANKCERLLLHFQQAGSFSSENHLERLNSMHKIRELLHQVKEFSTVRNIEKLKKELSLFQNFFTVPKNIKKTSHQGASTSSSLCNS